MFEEKDALAYMRTTLGSEIADLYSDDDLLNVVDAIWDYYEENGLLDLDVDDDDEPIPVDELYDYVKRMMRKDKGCIIKPEHIETIVDAELAYEEFIENQF